jgi:peptide chain release factor 1
MLDMMKNDISIAEKRIPELEESLKLALLPTDPNDNKNIIMEVRAGVGGDEAGIFAHELAEAYKVFARKE